MQELEILLIDRAFAKVANFLGEGFRITAADRIEMRPLVCLDSPVVYYSKTLGSAAGGGRRDLARGAGRR